MTYDEQKDEIMGIKAELNGIRETILTTIGKFERLASLSPKTASAWDRRDLDKLKDEAAKLQREVHSDLFKVELAEVKLLNAS